MSDNKEVKNTDPTLTLNTDTSKAAPEPAKEVTKAPEFAGKSAADELAEQVKQQDERDMLMKRAQTLGLKVSGNIGLDTLRQRISDHLNDIPQKKDDEDEDDKPVAKAAAVETYSQKLKRMKDEHTALIRVRITCMNPHKSEWTGEIFTVANKYLGTIKKFIPFGEATDKGYHIPKILYEEMKRRKYQAIRTVRRDGIDVIVPESIREVPEFSIEVLPPLTPKELDDLRISQAQTGSTTGD